MRSHLIRSLGVLLACAGVLRAASNAVIIQAWLPHEAAGLDWAPEDVDTLDELWNDCFLVYESFYSRAAIGENHDRIQMLWGQGHDFRRLNDIRYDPALLGVDSITDGSATATAVENTFKVLGGQMGPDESLFCYTWGHGAHDGPPLQPSKATHFALVVRPTWTNLWDTTFARMTDTVHSNRVFIMQECFGGGFIDDLADSVTTLACATAAGKSSFSCDDQSEHGSPTPEHELYGGSTWRHGEFSFHFFNALRGGIAVAPYASPDTYPTDPDLNNDGAISWSEAFEFNELYNSISRSKELPVYFEANNFWKVMPQMPGPKKTGYGAALTVVEPPETTATIYAFKGKNSIEFWAYNLQRDSWAGLESIPKSSSKRRVKDGGTLAGSPSGHVYATKGGCWEFWRYDISGDSWSQLADVPSGPASKKVRRGTASVCVPCDDSTDLVYLLKGNRTKEFYRYDARANHWDSLPSPPVVAHVSWGYDHGSSLASDGLGHVYLLRGRTNGFYEYDTAARTWTTKDSLPRYGRSGKSKYAKKGAGLAYFAGKVYAQKGNNSLELWVYDCATNTWSQAQDIADGMSNKLVERGGSIASADNFLWILKGKGTFDFCRFAPNRVVTAPEQGNPPGPGASELLIANGPCCGDPVFSHSGLYVAFTKAAATGHPQVFRALANGGGVQELTQLSTSCCLSPAWYSDDSKLAFIVEPDTGASKIGVVSSMGGPVVYLSSAAGDIEDFALSPSGASLVFSRSDSGDFTQLWICPLSGGGASELTTSSRDHFQPHFASDSEIVFRLDPADGPSQIGKLYLYHPDTANPGACVWKETTLTSTEHEHSAPCVAGSAGPVFFEVDTGGFTGLGRVKLNGDSECVIAASNGYDFEMPTTGPKGETLYCLRSTDAGAAVCEVYADGSGYNVLTDDEVERETPHARQNQGSPACATYIRDESVYRTLGHGEEGGQGRVLGVLALQQMLPNPCTGRLIIRWEVPRLTTVSLKLYNTAGQLVKTLANGETKPGRYETVWDGTDRRGRRVASGVYFCALEADKTRLNRKVVLTSSE
jgi:hypothetical protein